MYLLEASDRRWPERLRNMGEDMPASLWVHGGEDLRTITDRSVAIVGSRAATAYGRTFAHSLASALAEDGWTVVSGGASGIDTAAHRGALAARGRTVVSLPCGIARVHPPVNGDLFTEIARTPGCALVSKYHPNDLPNRTRFLARDKVTVGLVLAVVVVEAAIHSGSMFTARQALVYGRTLMAVPGPVTSAVSQGTNLLLADSARPALSVEGVVDYLSMLAALASYAEES